MENPNTWTPLEQLIADNLNRSPCQIAHILADNGFIPKATGKVVQLIVNEFNMYGNFFGFPSEEDHQEHEREYGFSLPKRLASLIQENNNE